MSRQPRASRQQQAEWDREERMADFIKAAELRKLEAGAKRRVAIVEHYLDGHTLEETGKVFGISRERVRQIAQMEGVEARHGYAIRAARIAAQVEAVLDEAMQAYRDGEDVTAIAKRLGVSRNALHKAIMAEASELDLRRHRSMRRMGAGQNYTDEELLDALRAANALWGAYHLSVSRYSAHRKAHGGPGELTIGKRFGSWNKALAAAGIPTKTSPEGFGARKYANEDILKAVRRVQEQHCDGALPSIDAYSAHRMGDEPSAATARNRFGTWREVLEALDGSSDEEGRVGA